ncbi:MAG: cupin domain-containing protein [Planctomycetota bacterium]|jgi:anti-sigma factor ChrR (cupin superfamily)
MKALSRDLNDLISVGLDEAALAKLEWRNFGTGVKLGKLGREGAASLVLYWVEDGAPRDAFARHRHPGGEAYLVLKGVIADETGRYPAGSFVWLPEESIHTPWAEGETVVLVLWPGGVKIEQDQ